MNFSSCMLISIFLSSMCTIVISGESANSKKKSPKKEEPVKQFFIDDMEGSGFEPDTKTDMVYSGSGYGPDDEDSPPTPKLRPGAGILKPEDRNNNLDKHEQTLPIPTTKSATSPSTTTKAAEPPFIEINTKAQEPEITHKPIDKQLPESEINSGDKSSVDDVNSNNGVYVVNTPDRDKSTSFFAQPGILAAVIGGAVVGLLCAILVVMFIVYRMRKKDEGSYPLEEMKRCPATNPYIKPNHREFFA